MTAYLKGYHAGIASLGIKANPYSSRSDEYDQWLEGYRSVYTA